MKIRNILAMALLMFGMSVSAKDYKYQTVAGDAMQSRIYTLENAAKAQFKYFRQLKKEAYGI